MKKRHLIIFALLFVMVVGATISGTMSYFTTYANAKGGMTINLGHQTRIREDMYGGKKLLEVENDKDSVPVYVRAKGIAASKYNLRYEGLYWTETLPDGWIIPDEDKDDNWCYYPYIINAGESTGTVPQRDNPNDKLSRSLQVTFDKPEDAKDGDTFSVLVVYESTPVKYKEDGTPYADWSTKLDIRYSEGGNQ